MLTPRQHETLTFLDAYIRKHGYSPSIDEIAGALNLASRSSAHRLLLCLEERGFIRRLQKRARAIQVVQVPKTPKEQN